MDRQIIKELQNGLPLAVRPYKIIGDRLNMTEKELIDRVRYLIENGFIRRFGAAVRHQDLGFKANAMVVWDVPDERVNDIGVIMAGFREVTHCYQRPRFPNWPYNLFTMVHGRSREECAKIAGFISQAVGIKKYDLLFSTAELKKISMRYFE
ncbi:Lrp/AsnC family transcriptional regulator [Pelotomaculum propionicicum]|uniref:siroheme decarboxylase subunit beta n=1 Tax=Pelotomaculum propionicicum TaxID=258475 RepID=UPI003BA2633B